MSGKYDDIINLPHHKSLNRRAMSMEERASQFSPFAALVGYDDSIDEANNFYEEKKILSKEQVTEINDKLVYINDHINDKFKVKINYFQNVHSNLGKYYEVEEFVSKIDVEKRNIILVDDTKISIKDILKLEIV